MEEALGVLGLDKDSSHQALGRHLVTAGTARRAIGKLRCAIHLLPDSVQVGLRLLSRRASGESERADEGFGQHTVSKPWAGSEQATEEPWFSLVARLKIVCDNSIRCRY
jgi:hypothetical protein